MTLHQPGEFEILVKAIQTKIRARRYRLTDHAEREREADQITIREIEEALLSSRCELIENYPDDPRGASCLLLGFTDLGRPIHAVCGLTLSDVIVMITVYRPDPDQWIDWRERRRKEP